MNKKGTLTGTQLEIMEILWSNGQGGMTSAEIWQELMKKRKVARTTVQTMVQRLAKRGWLIKMERDGALRYCPTMSRSRVTDQLTARFIEQVFGGSPEMLIRSLLGSKRIKPGELERIRRLLSKGEKKK